MKGGRSASQEFGKALCNTSNNGETACWGRGYVLEPLTPTLGNLLLNNWITLQMLIWPDTGPEQR